jgi:sugar phosphate isomerase/epimerase
MNIEEADFGMAFESMGDMLAYVHLADSQRMRYDGWASMECSLSGPADEVLPTAVRFLREQMARAEERAGVAA